jgi:hypothetical protein
MTTSLCIFIPDTSIVFKCVYRKVRNGGFQKEYNIILHKNALWRGRVQNKLLPKADIMYDNVHRSTNLSNKILLFFISELLFPSVWIFYSFLCFYESSVTINVTILSRKRMFYKTVNNTLHRITFGLRVHANWYISNNSL